MKVYLDDERKTPDGWIRTYTPAETIELLKTGMVTELSLDHDLGDDESIGTGNLVILWIEFETAVNKFHPPTIYVHTDNASARLKMLAGVKNIQKIYNNT